MRKTIVLLGLMVCFATGLSAQNIVGKWRAQPDTDEEGQQAVIELTFSQDKTLLINMIVSMNDPESMELNFHFSIDGTYANVENNVIPFKLNADKAVIAIDKLEFNGQMAEQMKDNEEMAVGIKKMMQKQIDASKDEMIQEFPSEGSFTISEFSGNTMKIQMSGDDQVLTLTKVE